MTLPLIVYRSLRQHALSTVITMTSIALAVGLLVCVWSVKTQSQNAFTSTTGGFDAVLGARGSKLQLVLNAIFNLEASPGNLQWTDYEYVKKLPFVRAAIPIAVGDNLKGYRLVGTLTDFFSVEYVSGKNYAIEPGGRAGAPELADFVDAVQGFGHAVSHGSRVLPEQLVQGRQVVVDQGALVAAERILDFTPGRFIIHNHPMPPDRVLW